MAREKTHSNLPLRLDNVSNTVRLWSPEFACRVRVPVADTVSHCEAWTSHSPRRNVFREVRGRAWKDLHVPAVFNMKNFPQMSRGCSRKKTNFAQQCNRCWPPDCTRPWDIRAHRSVNQVTVDFSISLVTCSLLLLISASVESHGRFVAT